MVSDLRGWVLVEAQLGHHGHDGQICLEMGGAADSGEVARIALPVLPTGRIHELVELPGSVSGKAWRVLPKFPADKATLTIRPVAWFERTWRMAYRVFNAFRQLSPQQRDELDLSMRRAILDLPDAYRIVTELRWRSSYSNWIERCDRQGDGERQQIQQHIAGLPSHPHFHLLVIAEAEDCGSVQRTIDSVKRLSYRNFTCVVAGDAGHAFDPDQMLAGIGLGSRTVARHHLATWLDQFNESLAEHQSDEWVILLRAGEVLPEHALYWFAVKVLAQPGAAIFYGDDDVLDTNGERCHPRFKPDWSLAHLRATHFLGSAVALRGREIAAAGGVSLDCCRYGNYDLLLRIVDVLGNEGEGRVAHIPAVLLHRASADDGRCLPEGLGKEGKATVGGESAWSVRALRNHLARNGVAGEVSETLPGCRRVRYSLSDAPPLVSIIVPTRDAPRLIRQCVDSLLTRTTYPRIEILVVDNQSIDPEALAYLVGIDGMQRNGVSVRILRYDYPFNYSAINNFAVGEASGEVLCLLNNDTEVISADWLEEMVGQLQQPRVGAVGAKLYFPDGRVQHAGDTVGPGGCANHLHSLIERDDPGYCNRAAVAQELSAVTAACLVTWRKVYRELGGLDEKYLKVAFNDVDYCLRLRAAGFRVVWTPHAELYHHESVSRGKDISWRKRIRAEKEVAVMRRRWRQEMKNDPFYNPNLNYMRPDFSLSHVPRVRKPWQIQ